MNGDIFKNWMEKTLLPSLKGPSCLVMDNASYHNVVLPEDKIPTSSNTVAQIKDWLKRERINFNNKCLKPELLQLVKEQNKPKVFLIDKIIAQNGHTSLRLPPYHSHLNPIELVWAKVKGQVADLKTTFRISDVKVLTTDALSQVDKDYWSKCEDHVIEEENRYWQQDGLWFVQPRMEINPLESSDSE